MPESIRIDRWLFYARFFKSRTLAAKACASGGVRVDGAVVDKARHLVRPGEIVQFAQGRRRRIVKVVAVGHRRGPVAEAQSLYEDRTPAEAPRTRQAPAVRDPGMGRPTKRERRRIDRLKDW